VSTEGGVGGWVEGGGWWGVCGGCLVVVQVRLL
jgi:hypothetical protein